MYKVGCMQQSFFQNWIPAIVKIGDDALFINQLFDCSSSNLAQ